MSDLANQRVIVEEAMQTRRAIGVFFMILATAALAWDAHVILTGYGVGSVSGVAHIWQALDKTSYEVIEQMAVASSAGSLWSSVALPLMSIPAFVLFGVLGLLLLLRGSNHEIKARAPSADELEMVRQGMDPRRTRRR